MQELRDYQQQASDLAVEFLQSAASCDRMMMVAPCGTGKSYIELDVLERLEDCTLLTPRTEIIDGMVDKGGDPDRIFTPVTFRNRLLRGELRAPKYLLVDEAHHDTCDTAEQIRLCIGDAPTVAFTATPYRGTPQGTTALRALYGEPHWILTLRDAADRGYVSIPACRTVPILDDDIVEITNGDFEVTRVDASTDWNLACGLIQDSTGIPTVVALPSVRSCRQLADMLRGVNVSAHTVTCDTKSSERRDAFNACMSGEAVLLQVNVVSEGVDFPFRKLVDLSPTMSPVKWLQQFGRIMRPGGVSEYVCANRNLLRHGYLLEGLIPCEVFKQAQDAFPAPSKRTGIRAFGLEGVGRLKPCAVPLANGLQASAYYVTRDRRAQEYCAIVLLNDTAVLWAMRCNRGDAGEFKWGRWERCDPPSELKGFASSPPRPLSPKQLDWWRHPYRGAKSRGLDPDAEVDAKVFAALPVLCDLQMRVL